MKTYRELSYFGDNIREFWEKLKTISGPDWRFSEVDEDGWDSISVLYSGKKYQPAKLWLSYSNDDDRTTVKVINIVPEILNELSYDQYNDLLLDFSKEVSNKVLPFVTGIFQEGPSSDVFTPLDYIDKDTLDKLITFSELANKSTGTSHPCDKERWYDFVVTSFENNKYFESSVFERYLEEELGWSSDKALEIVIEYEEEWGAIEAYKNKTGGK